MVKFIFLRRKNICDNVTIIKIAKSNLGSTNQLYTVYIYILHLYIFIYLRWLFFFAFIFFLFIFLSLTWNYCIDVLEAPPNQVLLYNNIYILKIPTIPPGLCSRSNLATCPSYSISNYVKITVFHFFIKVNKEQLKMLNVNT